MYKHGYRYPMSTQDYILVPLHHTAEAGRDVRYPFYITADEDKVLREVFGSDDSQRTSFLHHFERISAVVEVEEED